ncbi:MAG: sulfotransferase [Proteobacteria bacterium]|nr:sulfotransferase [Pseudomonadota bacterium]
MAPPGTAGTTGRDGAPEAAFARALALHKNGRLDEAERLYREVLAEQPHHGDTLHYLGLLTHQAGDPEAAIGLIERAIQAGGSDPLRHYNLGEAYRALGRSAEAARCYRATLAADPEDAGAELGLADSLYDLGELRAAVHHYRRALALMPDDPEIHNNLATALLDQGDTDGALAGFERALALDPGFSEAHLNRANALRDAGRIDEALAAIDRYEATTPEPVKADLARAACRQAMGDRDGARTLLVREIERDPGDLQALSMFARISPEAPDASIAALEAALAKPGLHAEDRRTAAFALGETLDRAGRFDEAFARYREGNALAAARRAYNAAATAALFARIEGVFDEAFFAAGGEAAGSPDPRPVFIVGMPRSGTTLVEQIAASHPRVHGAGEHDDLGRIAAALAETSQAGQPFPEGARTLTGEAALSAAERYLAAIARDAGDALRITDKMPTNFRFLGLAARLFPRARVIHIRRGALDTCLSCYMQDFTGALDFSNELEGLGHHYRLYDRLMRHWRNCLPIPMLELRYEDLVADLDSKAREIVDFLGLEWDSRCLRFHETERAVLTASTWQVRTPLYASAIGRWRNYERHLGPLRDALGSLADDHEQVSESGTGGTPD